MVNEFMRSIEKDVGLPLDLIKEVPDLIMSFYLKNKEKMEIGRGHRKILYYLTAPDLINQYLQFAGDLTRKSDKPISISEDKMEDFLFGIDFRGAKIDTEQRIDGIPKSRFI